MKITYYGHGCVGLKIADIFVLVDPFITGNPKASHIPIDTIEADYILITHAHEDHILDVEAIARRTKATLISNYEIISHYEKLGLKGHPMNHGGNWTFTFGDVKYVNAVHTSSFPDGSYGGQPGGFVIKSEHKTIYIAGDTALTMDMKLIALQYKIDLAILPIGDNFTMGINDAILASDFVACNDVLGYHYDTFGYIEIDHATAKQKFSEKNKNLTLLKIGDSITL